MGRPEKGLERFHMALTGAREEDRLHLELCLKAAEREARESEAAGE